MEVTKKEALRIGEELGINFKVISLKSFRRGIEVELEHSGTILRVSKPGIDTMVVAGMIARDHLKEKSDYYNLLDKFVEPK